jgi:hypothetical protein
MGSVLICPEEAEGGQVFTSRQHSTDLRRYRLPVIVGLFFL